MSARLGWHAKAAMPGSVAELFAHAVHCALHTLTLAAIGGHGHAA